MNIQIKWKGEKSKYRYGTDNGVPVKYTGLNIPIPAQKPNNPPCEERALWTGTMDNIIAEKILSLGTGTQIKFLFTQSGPWGAVRLQHPSFNTVYNWQSKVDVEEILMATNMCWGKKKNNEKQYKIRFSICQFKKTKSLNYLNCIVSAHTGIMTAPHEDMTLWKAITYFPFSNEHLVHTEQDVPRSLFDIRVVAVFSMPPTICN